MSIRIVTDSTSDIPESLADEHGVFVLPAYVNVGDDSYLDQVQLSRSEFYEMLPSLSEPPTTAAPAVGAFTEAYDKLADEGAEEILSIHLSANLSGMLNAARLGAQATDAVQVTLFDSRQLSMGLGLLALTAAQDAAAGYTMEEITTRLQRRVGRTHVFAVLDTLEYLRRSGRVSWAAFGVGTLLRIKPLLHVFDGNVEMIERVRTRGRAVRRLIEHVEALGPLERLVILHTRNAEGAAALGEEAAHLFPAQDQDDFLTVEVTPTIGAHIGPGALGFACLAAGEA
ncbi:MAG: DegV family protein [Candidatus Promineifilaceae bacterium]|nr:DegV family protein [Candidatus Promineifilaceae bacterium]